MTEKIFDLGCGSRKAPGSIGVDIHRWPGVDVVADLNQVPWDLEDSAFDTILCTHFIEHVYEEIGICLK